MDFTLSIYESFLNALLGNYDIFSSFKECLPTQQNSGSDSLIVLRHDVDRIPINALKMAQLEHSLGVRGTYYFRIVKESYDIRIMESIALLGHEIGYHYEDMDLVSKSGLITSNTTIEERIDKAYESFIRNLDLFRGNFEIKTICMHGSPLSKFDNRIIWNKYDYKKLGLIGEPYYDIDYEEFAYFTDTGRRWNGNSVSVRDTVKSKYNFNFQTTGDLISNIYNLPNKLMFNMHPHRWFNPGIFWVRELILQNIKNVVKYLIVKRK